LNIIDAFHQLGSYRAAARACGTTDKTVKRAVERHQAGESFRMKEVKTRGGELAKKKA
jgi:hypothetical protein